MTSQFLRTMAIGAVALLGIGLTMPAGLATLPDPYAEASATNGGNLANGCKFNAHVRADALASASDLGFQLDVVGNIQFGRFVLFDDHQASSYLTHPLGDSIGFDSPWETGNMVRDQKVTSTAKATATSFLEPNKVPAFSSETFTCENGDGEVATQCEPEPTLTEFVGIVYVITGGDDCVQVWLESNDNPGLQTTDPSDTRVA